MAEDPHPTEYEIASPLQRVIAHAIDSTLPFLLLGLMGGVLNLESLPGIFLLILGIAATLAYRIFGDSYFNGHALGKRLMGIRVFDAKLRKPCTHKQSFLRNCILFIPMMPLIELVFLSIDGQERWGDRLARTYVMRDRALPAPPHAPDRPLHLDGLEETLRHKPGFEAQKDEVG